MFKIVQKAHGDPWQNCLDIYTPNLTKLHSAKALSTKKKAGLLTCNIYTVLPGGLILNDRVAGLPAVNDSMVENAKIWLTTPIQSFSHSKFNHCPSEHDRYKLLMLLTVARQFVICTRFPINSLIVKPFPVGKIKKRTY